MGDKGGWKGEVDKQERGMRGEGDEGRVREGNL